jgi:hypothetical protein
MATEADACVPRGGVMERFDVGEGGESSTGRQECGRRSEKGALHGGKGPFWRASVRASKRGQLEIPDDWVPASDGG